MKKVAVIGIGNVGSALGRRFAEKGHNVTFGVRDPKSDKTKRALGDIKAKVAASTVPEAVKASEIVVLATPWPATQQAIQSAGDLSGKILVDCTNPLNADLKSLALGTTTSAAESIAGWAPKASVVKAFNTTGFENMLNPVYGSDHLTMFICGDDKKAKAAVSELAKDIGFDPVDCGPLYLARTFEPMALLWIHLAVFEKLGTRFGFKLIRQK